MANQVFVSYSRRDDAEMRRIVAFLRGEGINVWVDNEKLVPGTPIWEAEIEKAIYGASAIVVILSPDSKKSVWVRREISLAERYQKRFFPIMVAGDEDSSITLRLITNQYVDIRENEETGLKAFSTALSFYLEELEMREKAVSERVEREVTAEQVAKEKSEREAGKKAAREKAEREAVEKSARERVERETADRKTAEIAMHKMGERKVADFLRPNVSTLSVNDAVYIFPWQKRILIGGVAGLLIWIMAVLVLSDQVASGSWAITIIGCGLAGILLYPHKSVVVLLSIGFLVWGFIGAITIGSESSTVAEKIAYFVTTGVFYGSLTGGLFSRILYWLKVIK